ncbi:MAG TPA: hypothetical protein VK471_11255 [Solirubrobacterales bacterium]|nr:hypothetical protein [Solirubrobacterales bacterium]
MLERLLAVPIEQGHAAKQQSGRLAKSLDAYVAYELRRAGFPESAVFPRAQIPRVFPAEFAQLEEHLHELVSAMTTHETKTGERLKPATVRKALVRLRNSLPGTSNSEVLGRFYVKQVDVVVSDWRRGPDVLVSGKSMLSSYRNNLKNRYEEAIGEAYNLRDRYPLAAMGYAYIVRSNIFEEEGALELLRDLLVRLRRPDGPFDATMLLLGEWTGDPPKLVGVDDPASTLSVSRFFEDLLSAVMDNTPVTVHQEIRLRKEGERLGGMPPSDEATPESGEGRG